MRSFRAQWTTNIWTYAQRLFWFLAFIEFAWSAIALALDKTDLQSWVAGLIRKLMWIGAFWTLLVNGSTWIPAILDSFEQIGQNAAGMAGPISPSGIFVQGLDIAGSLLTGASGSAFLSGDIGSALLCAVGALLIFISYVIIAINLVVTLVESYLVVSAGYIFLGFGGSRWTAPYTERYIGLAVSIGIKLLLLYCIIAAGQTLGTGWNAEASGIGTSTSPAKTALDVIGGALIYMMCCWQIPKLFSAVIGGAPALTGGDLVATGTAVAGGALAAASLGVGAVATLASGGAAGVAGAGAAGAGGLTAASTSSAASAGSQGLSAANAVSTVGSARSISSGTSSNPGMAAVSPPPFSANSSRTGNVVSPPSTTPPGAITPDQEMNSTGGSQFRGASVDDIGAEPLAGSGFESERPARGFVESNTSAPSGPSGSSPAATAHSLSPASPLRGDDHQGSAPKPSVNWVARNAANTSERLRSASDAIRKIQLRDAAHPGSPPRMPIDHHE